MSEVAPLPEPDRTDPAPHPRHVRTIYGQGAAEHEFLAAFNAGRKHHAWLLTGPRGVGKATLAWRIARFLLATPPVSDGGLFGETPKPQSLDIAPEHPVWAQTEALSHPGLFLLRRGPNDKGDRLSTVLRIDEVRRAKAFVQMSGAENAARVVIVDAADEMNVEAANAFLKMLEEPPEDTTILMISHQPARLLPTIRSRCRTLALAPLGPEDLSAAIAAAELDMPLDPTTATLASGSPGEAVRLLASDGAAIYDEWLGYLAGLPRPDASRLTALADKAGAHGAEARLDATLGMLNLLLVRLARFGAGAGAGSAVDGEDEAFARLAPGPHEARIWAEAQLELSSRAARARAVNLDPAAVILDMGHSLKQTAAKISGRP